MRIIWHSLGVLLFGLTSVGIAHAQPYGKGTYGANVPYGSQTSLTIATNGNVTIPITPVDSGTLGTGTSTVTVTSTDVVGYKLYIQAETSTNMTNGAATLPASANGSPAALATNTWGYNTDASSDFVGITLTNVLVKNAVGPYSAGDNTTFTYGVKVDNTKPAGNYAATVTYTAVPQTD
jgi:phage tail tube protein FII